MDNIAETCPVCSEESVDAYDISINSEESNESVVVSHYCDNDHQWNAIYVYKEREVRDPEGLAG
jgi:hypothetical protein